MTALIITPLLSYSHNHPGLFASPPPPALFLPLPLPSPLIALIPRCGGEGDLAWLSSLCSFSSSVFFCPSPPPLPRLLFPVPPPPPPLLLPQQPQPPPCTPSNLFSHALGWKRHIKRYFSMNIILHNSPRSALPSALSLPVSISHNFWAPCLQYGGAKTFKPGCCEIGTKASIASSNLNDSINAE